MYVYAYIPRKDPCGRHVYLYTGLLHTVCAGLLYTYIQVYCILSVQES